MPPGARIAASSCAGAASTRTRERTDVTAMATAITTAAAARTTTTKHHRRRRHYHHYRRRHHHHYQRGYRCRERSFSFCCGHRHHHQGDADELEASEGPRPRAAVPLECGGTENRRRRCVGPGREAEQSKRTAEKDEYDEYDEYDGKGDGKGDEEDGRGDSGRGEEEQEKSPHRSSCRSSGDGKSRRGRRNCCGSSSGGK